MSLILKIPDYDSGDNTIPKLQKDSMIDAGTLSLLDFLDTNCYASGTLPVGAIANGFAFKDLVSGAADSTAQGAISGGVSATSGLMLASNQRLVLPTSLRLASTATHFGFGAWIKPSSSPDVPAGSYAHLCGCEDSSSAANCQWMIQQTGTTPTSFQGQVGGAVLILTCTLDIFTQIFFTATITAGAVTLRSYKNGVLFATSAPSALSGGVLPVPANVPYLGRSPAYSYAMKGGHGRFSFQDFTIAGSTSDEAAFVAAEYTHSVGRFS